MSVKNFLLRFGRTLILSGLLVLNPTLDIYAETIAPSSTDSSPAPHSVEDELRYASTGAVNVSEEDRAQTAINFLMMLLVVSFAISLAYTCFLQSKKVPSSGVFILSSMAYIIGEIVSYFKFKNLLGDEFKVDLTQKYKEQAEILRKLITSNKGVLDYVGLQKKFTMGVAVGFSLATALALGEAIFLKVNPPVAIPWTVLECGQGEREDYIKNNSGTKGQGQGSELGKELESKIDDTVMDAGKGAGGSGSGTGAGAGLKPGGGGILRGPRNYRCPEPSLNPKWPSLSQLLPLWNWLMMGETWAAATSTHDATLISMANDENRFLESEIEKNDGIGFTDFFVNGEINFQGILGALGLTATLIGAFVFAHFALKPKVNRWLRLPWFRAPFFAAATALAWLRWHYLTEKEEKIKMRIKTLETLANSLENMKDEETLDESRNTLYDKIGPSIKADIREIRNNRPTQVCLNNAKVDKTCLCKQQPKGCNGLGAGNMVASGFGIPSSMGPMMDMNNRYSQSLNNGNMIQGSAMGAQLGRYAAQLRAQNEKSAQELSDILTAAGEKPYNLNALRDKVLAQIKTAANDGLQNKGLKPIEFSPFSVFDEMNDKLAPTSTASADNNAVAANDQGAASAGAGNANSPAKDEMNFDLEGSGLEDNAVANGGAVVEEDGPILNTLENNMKESNLMDIHQNQNTSIFALLSSRYLRTAYPILLEEAK